MIIGIGGCSRSGKSTLAKSLVAELEQCLVLPLDNYGFPEESLPIINDRHDWEIPEAYNFDRLISDVRELSSKEVPLIVEGILVFYDPRLSSIFDKKFFLKIHQNTFYHRRSAERRWGKEPDWFIDYVWRSFLKYGQPKNISEFQLLDGETPIDISSLLSEIHISS